MKSVLEKIGILREDIKKYPLKKSGRNNFRKFNYFETKDFLPFVDEISKQIGILTTLNFKNKNIPSLTVS